MAARVRIQVIRRELETGPINERKPRWVACGSLTFTLTQGKRLIASSLYTPGATRLVEVGTGNVLYTKPA